MDTNAKWLFYIDFLGFKKLVKKHKNNPDYIHSIYREIINKISQNEFVRMALKKGDLHVCWFSDTFIFWTNDSSPESFALLETASRHFFYNLVITHSIPARGCITCDLFNAYEEDTIFFGEGLSNAHTFAENQKWINYILHPLAVKQLEYLGMAERLHYYPLIEMADNVFASHKSKIMEKYSLDQIFAFTYSANDSLVNIIERSFNRMYSNSQETIDTDENIKTKYDNSFTWIELQKKRWKEHRLEIGLKN